MAARLDDARGRLDQELANARAVAADELPALRALASAQAVLKELKDEEKRRNTSNKAGDKLRAAAQAAESLLGDAVAGLARLEHDRIAWDRDWSARCAALPPEIAAEPTAVGAWLAQQSELERARRELSDLAVKIEGRRERIADLDTVLIALVGRARALDPTLGIPEALAPHNAFPALHEQTTRARKRRDEREKARDKHALARKELEQAAEVRDQRRAALEQAWAELEAEPSTDAALDASRGRAATAEALRQDLARLGTMLDGHWRKNQDAFIARLIDHDRVEIEGEMQALDLRIADRKATLDGCSRQQHEAEAALSALDAAHDALAVEQGFTESRGALLDKVEELLRLRVARLLLEEARRRATVEGSDLEARASEAFTALTSGAYRGLRIEHDEQQGAGLVAIESSGEEKTPTELSTGTLDQVWLAVRLAAIEQAARETPFPRVLDDVFVQFDDGRTRAALRLLAQLSAHVQVIVFTHHDHLVDLARGAIPEHLTVATLPRPDGSPRVRTLAEHRTPHPRPVPEDDAAGSEGTIDEEVTSGRRTRRSRVDTSAAEQVILDLLADRGGSLGKSDLIEAGLERGHDLAADWGGSIKALVDSGRVVQEGQKRGTRYALSA